MERSINPLFNVFEKYSDVNIINPHRFGVPFVNDKSFDFNGTTGHLDFGNIAALDVERTDACSFSFWAKVNRSGFLDTFFSKRDATSNNRGIQFYIHTTGKLRAFLSSQHDSGRIYIETTDSFYTTDWQFYTLTYTGSSTASGFKIFVDAVEITSITVHTDNLSTTTLSSASFQIGAKTSGGDYGKVTVDEFSKWNKTLSQSEVTELYNGGTPTNPLTHSAAANLIFYPRAENSTTGAGNVLDQSGNGYNGTITGGVTISTDVP